MEFADRLGRHLRRIRRQRGLSLQDVEHASGGAVKASVLGAYERGDRAVSAGRLAALAELYGVGVRSMLPPDPDDARSGGVVAIDIARATESQAPLARIVARYVRGIVGRRAGSATRVVRLRTVDVQALAAAADLGVADLVKRLDDAGLIAH